MQTKKCTACGEEKVLSEFYKNKKGKFGVRGNCKECTIAQNAAYQEANKEKVAARKAVYYQKNKDKIDARKAMYYQENKDKIAVRDAAYREANKKEIAAQKAAYREANPDKANANNAKRRARKLQASPEWADKRKMQAFYTESKRLEKETGIKHNVDHEVPLVHPLVCGLHCEFNLQVLTATENGRKYNSFDVETE